MCSWLYLVFKKLLFCFQQGQLLIHVLGKQSTQYLENVKRALWLEKYKNFHFNGNCITYKQIGYIILLHRNVKMSNNLESCMNQNVLLLGIDDL